MNPYMKMYALKFFILLLKKIKILFVNFKFVFSTIIFLIAVGQNCLFPAERGQYFSPQFPLSFDDMETSFPADIKRFYPAGKIIIKKFIDKDGFEIIDSVTGSPGLRIVWPPLELKKVDFSSMRISGSTTAGAFVYVYDQPIKVFPTGAFATTVNLVQNENNIVIISKKDDCISSAVLKIVYSPKPKIETSLEFPLTIDKSFTDRKEEIFLSSGESLAVRMKGSPGAMAYFQIGDVGKKIQMIEENIQTQKELKDIRGIYSGIFAPAENDDFENLPIFFSLNSAINTSETVSLQSGILISVRPAERPLIAEVNGEKGFGTLFKDFNGGRIARLPNKTKFVVATIEKDFVKIKTNTKDTFCIKKDEAKILKNIDNLPVAEVGDLSPITDDKDSFNLLLRISEKTPFLISIVDANPKLELTLFGTKMNLASQLSQKNEVISGARLEFIWNEPRLNSDFLSSPLTIKWDENFNWGIVADYGEKGFYLRIKKSPPLCEPNLFKGLRVCIDPGHGGEWAGAVGCLGFEEKEANLKISQYLSKKLLEAGAEVILTRNTDEDISLEERLEKAVKFGAHIFLSVHNNSIGSESDGLNIFGTTTFYYQPNANMLAEEIYSKLSELPLKPRGCKKGSYFVTRPIELVPVLIEGVFISNPYEERLLISDSFQEKMAGKIFEGVKGFLKTLSKKN